MPEVETNQDTHRRAISRHSSLTRRKNLTPERSRRLRNQKGAGSEPEWLSKPIDSQPYQPHTHNRSTSPSISPTAVCTAVRTQQAPLHRHRVTRLSSLCKTPPSGEDCQTGTHA